MNKRRKRRTFGTSSPGSGAGTKRKNQTVQSFSTVASTVPTSDRNGSSPPIVSSTTSSPNTGKDTAGSMEVFDGANSALLSHFGHGHLTALGMTQLNGVEPDSGISISLGKAVGARKRKPTQISKIVEKPSSDGDEESEEESFEEISSEDHLHNNNNDSPPNYKKPWNQTGNGMIQSIVTELKSCARKSRESSNQPCSPPRSTASSKSSRSRYHSSSTEELNEHDEISCGDDAGSFHCKETKLEKPGKNRKVDLANIHTLVGNEDEDSGGGGGLDLTGNAYVNADGKRKTMSKHSGDPDRDESIPMADTFRCGVCSYGSLDKATLLRHMKTHSGERPFQCRLCFFAFTTKANCERHLRNRHGQVDRTQIRTLIVRFPTSNNGSESEAESHSPPASQSSYHHLQNALTGSSPATSAIPLAKNLTSGGLLLQPKAKMISNPSLSILHQSIMSRLESPGTKSELVKTPVPEDDGNAPLDLSMDAMDLSVSKKGRGTGKTPSSLLRPRAMYPNSVQSRDLSNLLQTSPFVSKREAFVHPQISMPLLSADSQYGGLFQNGCSPFSPPTTNSTSVKSNTNPMDLASALHVGSPFPMYPFSSALTGNGAGIPSQFPSFNLGTSGLIVGHLNANSPQMSPSKIATSFMTPSPSTTNFGSRENLRPSTPDLSDKESTETKHTVENLEEKLILDHKSKVFVSPIVGTGGHKKRHSEGTKSGSSSGDYQKPKQRRYRTERPFSCPHCPARFTLRSNMERHGKHQHPTVWQRSPSNRVINRQQKNQQLQSQNPLVGPPTLVHPNKYSSGFEMLPPAPTKGRGRHSNHNQAHNMSQSPTSTVDSSVNVRAVIAQQLKRKLSSTAMGHGDGHAKAESESDEPSPAVQMNGAGPDLASVSQLLDRVKNSNIAQYFNSGELAKHERENYEEDEEMDDDDDDEGQRSEDLEDEEVDIESEEESPAPRKRGRPAKEDTSSDGGRINLSNNKKKSAYSSAPHKISCPHCSRRFPWFSSLRRHLLTHTGQKPYQCSKCPLLFTTKSNCDRHLARKHNGRRANGKSRQTTGKSNSKSAPGTGSSNYNSTEEDVDDEDVEGTTTDSVEKIEEAEIVSTTPVTRSSNYSKPAPTGSNNSSPAEDVVFRCHLCEAAAGEREVLLAHMEEEHKDIYKMLVTKGALNSSPNTSENSEVDGTTPPNPGETQPLLNTKEVTTHRKVMCVFCVRRFWSVEDLRRHIRSHSGERPFSCPHCSRRFTLKHSMLRHLKKHGNSGINTPISGLELGGEDTGDPSNSQVKLTVPPIKIRRPRGRIPNALKKQGITSRYTRAAMVAAPAPVTTPNNRNEAAESDLIGRLLGIHDESLVEKLLNKPDAKDAAKLLGLRSGNNTSGAGSTN